MAVQLPGEDSFVHEIEELRNTDEQSDPMTMKRIDHTLW